MPIIEVAHIKTDLSFEATFVGMRGEKALIFFVLNALDEYSKVAEVAADSFADAYRVTNNIDGPWVDNDAVSTSLPDCRSTTIGDILSEKGSNDIYIVAARGFIKHTLAPINRSVLFNVPAE